MDPYIKFQIFAWIICVLFIIWMTIDWLKGREEFKIEVWIFATLISFVIFTVPVINGAAVIVVMLATFGEVCRAINAKINKWRNL